MTTALALAWGAVVFIAMTPARPAPARVRSIETTTSDPSPRAGRWSMPALALGVLMLAVSMGSIPSGAAGFLAAAVCAGPPLASRRARRRTSAGVAAAVPETIDLLAVAAAGGLPVWLALVAVTPRCPPAVRPAFEQAIASVRRGSTLADALERLGQTLGGPATSLVAALSTSAATGAPLGEPMARIAVEARATRRRAAEERARTVPVKLLFPLVVCILPAFGLLTVVPLIAAALSGLRLS